MRPYWSPKNVLMFVPSVGTDAEDLPQPGTAQEVVSFLSTITVSDASAAGIGPRALEATKLS